MIERCGDRQLKCDGLQKWPLHFCIESLPVMLQVALLLLICGLCKHMWLVNATVAYTLIILAGLGVLFYLVIVFVGTLSYACPFQTPASTALRDLWKVLRRWAVLVIEYCKETYEQETVRLKQVLRLLQNPDTSPFPHRQPPPPTPPEDAEADRLEDVQVEQPREWLTPKDLVKIHRADANDARCVSWILRSITDPEALDAAVQLAGKVQWFKDGADTEPPYDVIISAFHTCFDSNGNVYPGSRDRAYHSGQAIQWIHTLAKCKSDELTHRFPFLFTTYKAPDSDCDLACLLKINSWNSVNIRFIEYLSNTNPGHPHPHSLWMSNILLHHTCANRSVLDFNWIQQRIPRLDGPAIPLDIMLNRLLVWCICLDSPVKEGMLRAPDKLYEIFSFTLQITYLFTSDHLEQILRQLSNAITPAINPTHHRHRFIPHVLRDLTKLESRSKRLSEVAYQWCSLICENHQNTKDLDHLLLSLEIGFRPLDPQRLRFYGWHLVHTEHHQQLINKVFKSNDGEAIADLLRAWTIEAPDCEPAYPLLNTCVEHLVGLHNLEHFSPRLRRLVIRAVELIGYKGFEGVEVKSFCGLLDYLKITIKDMDRGFKWVEHLLGILQFPEGIQHLSHWYWKLLVELAVSWSKRLRNNGLIYNPEVMESLVKDQKWDKLECWIGTVWIMWPPGSGTTEEGLKDPMLLLFGQEPNAVQELTQWMEQWSEAQGGEVPESFKQICQQASEASQTR